MDDADWLKVLIIYISSIFIVLAKNSSTLFQINFRKVILEIFAINAISDLHCLHTIIHKWHNHLTINLKLKINDISKETAWLLNHKNKGMGVVFSLVPSKGEQFVFEIARR